MTHSRGKWLGFALIVVGLVFLLDSTGTLDVGDAFWTYWPLLLVVWGIAVLTRSGARRRRRGADQAPAPGPVPAGAGVSGESIESSNTFGDVEVRVTSPSFRGGSATTVFGDISVDCRQGGLAEGEHTLTVSGVFGDSTVILPPGAAVDITAHSLIGDVSVLDQKRAGFSATIRHTTPGFETASRKLRINISQVFGEIDVRQ